MTPAQKAGRRRRDEARPWTGRALLEAQVLCHNMCNSKWTEGVGTRVDTAEIEVLNVMKKQTRQEPARPGQSRH